MADDLEARLESHAQAFEGLLSLIPAKEYYGQDNSDQWQRKKQTKEEKRAAKRAKLNPENQKSAKDVMDDNERKRKREMGIESDHEDLDLDVELEKPGEGLRKTVKKQSGEQEEDEESTRKTKAEKRKEKRQEKKEKADRKKEKLEAKKAQRQESDLNEVAVDGEAQESDEEEGNTTNTADVDAMDFSGLADPDSNDVSVSQQSSAPTSPNADTPTFDMSANQSAASSSSSVIPPTTATTNGDSSAPATNKKEKAFTLPKVNQEELQARLRARIEQLRARRKADGPHGQPARNRQELLEARRKKEEARKQHKKELRLKAKQEEERLKDERLRGSGSPLSADIFSPRIRSPASEENSFSFGRVAFADGAEADASLQGIEDRQKASRLAGYDDAKRADIEEKDAWLNAKKRAHGERVRDDTSLLKKALKRKEKGKLKSEKEWNERKEGVQKGIAARQKKREENLAKRKEDKGTKGKKKGGKPAKGGKKGRPGFEGKFGG
ncbi:hypothetical protein H2203_004448 [Taxawa tesnikishii (nom. ined.)]|nr:hypothetical protein H2203_004448 [Dothideales sp. JES 119]